MKRNTLRFIWPLPVGKCNSFITHKLFYLPRVPENDFRFVGFLFNLRVLAILFFLQNYFNSLGIKRHKVGFAKKVTQYSRNGKRFTTFLPIGDAAIRTAIIRDEISKVMHNKNNGLRAEGLLPAKELWPGKTWFVTRLSIYHFCIFKKMICYGNRKI